MRHLILATALLALPARAEFMDHLANPDDVGLSKAPRYGDASLLVIPVEIRGVGFSKLDHGRIERFFTEESDVALRFRSYWKTQSGGRYSPTVTVAPTMVFEGCPEELGVNCRVIEDASIVRQLGGFLRTVLHRADAGCFSESAKCVVEQGLDFSKLDVSGAFGRPDGFADGVMLVTNLPDVGLALPVSALNDGEPISLDGVGVTLAAACGDKPSNARVTAENVCTREFGNLLGLSSLAQDSNWAKNHPEDRYPGLAASLMGPWDGGDEVVMLDAESRYRLGWTGVRVVSGEEQITLKLSADGGGVVKLGMQSGDHREYFLVEARGPSSVYDATMRQTDGEAVYGLSVVRVNWAQGPSGSFVQQLAQCVNCRPFDAFVSNVQADGRFDIQLGRPFFAEEDLFTGGRTFADVADVHPRSATHAVWGANWSDGAPSGVAIRNVRVDASRATVTADFIAPHVVDVCADVRCARGMQCSTSGACEFPPETESAGKLSPRRKPVEAPAGSDWGCTSAPVGLLAFAALFRSRRRTA